MSTVEFCYEDVFELALRLSPEEQTRLLRELPNGTLLKSEEPQKSTIDDEYIKRHGIPVGGGFVMLTIPGEPIISRSEMQEIK